MMNKFSTWGLVEQIGLNSTQVASANHLHYAWTTIPHVTQFDKADINHDGTLSLEELLTQELSITQKIIE